MKPGLRSLLVTVALAILAAGGGAWLSAHLVVSRNAARPSLHDMAHKNLDLTPDQSRRLDAIEERYAAERLGLEADMRAANRQLADAIREGDEDSPKVTAAVDHLHLAMGALQKATITHVFEMRAVLTPEQAKAFDAEVFAALTEAGR